MNKLVIINATRPICQECGGGMLLHAQIHGYRCMHCGKVYKIVGAGKKDKEIVCETKAD